MVLLDRFAASVVLAIFSVTIYGVKVVFGGFMLISATDIVDAGVGEIA